jgi:predicted enzyme related to lactoylglutathione lyase
MELSLLVLKTHQPDQLRDFYQDLGLTFQEEQHGKGPVHFSTTIGQTVLEIYPLTKSVEKADTSTRLGFRISGLEQVIFQVKEKGRHILSEPQHQEWGFTAIVKDPDGRSIELIENGI